MRLLIAFCLLCDSAAAGPWLRDAGTQFLSVSVEGSSAATRPEYYGSLYYEYGFGPKLTLGLDAGRDSWGQMGTLMLVRVPVIRSEASDIVTTELGVGSFRSRGGTHLAFRPGLSWARGLNIWQGGWMSLDATYAMVPALDYGLAKLEGTIGVNSGHHWKVFIQATAEKSKRQEALFSATPSIALRIGSNMHLVGGAVLRSDESVSAKLGIWWGN